MSEIINVSEENFESEIIKSEKAVLVDFWATWCGPCKLQGPIFEEVAEEYGEAVKFAKANVEDVMELAQKLKPID